MKDKLIEEMCNSIKPLTLRDLIKIPKDDLIKIILEREISYNNLVEELKSKSIHNTKSDFWHRQLEFILVKDSDLRDSWELNKKIEEQIKRIHMLENKNLLLKNFLNKQEGEKNEIRIE